MSKNLDEYVKEKILQYFRKNCWGRKNAKKKDYLITEIDNCYGVKMTDREFRDVISSIAEIGSHNSIGYFFLVSWEDLKMAQAEIHSRIVALSERAKAQEESFYNRQGNQGQLL